MGVGRPTLALHSPLGHGQPLRGQQPHLLLKLSPPGHSHRDESPEHHSGQFHIPLPPPSPDRDLSGQTAPRLPGCLTCEQSARPPLGNPAPALRLELLLPSACPQSLLLQDLRAGISCVYPWGQSAPPILPASATCLCHLPQPTGAYGLPSQLGSRLLSLLCSLRTGSRGLECRLVTWAGQGASEPPQS